MRKLVTFVFAVAVAIAANNALAGITEEPQAKQNPTVEGQAQPKQAQEKQTQKQTETKTAAKDPNFRFRNGQWFYHFPQTGAWKVWDGKQWNDVPTDQTRTFSFEQPAATEFNTNYSNTYRGYSDYSYPSNRIIGSYGFRGAGSKIEGRY